MVWIVTRLLCTIKTTGKIMRKESRVKNARSPIGKSALLVASVFIFSISISIDAQQLPEDLPKELPETFGVYLNAMEGLIKWEDMKLSGSSLEDWTPEKVENVSGQDFSITSYFALLAKIPENSRLYRLRTGYFKPSLALGEEIKLSIMPVTGIPELAGNMVQIVPDRILTKGNYIFVEGKIGEVDRCWIFTVDGGEEMWEIFDFWEWCSSCLSFWK